MYKTEYVRKLTTLRTTLQDGVLDLKLMVQTNPDNIEQPVQRLKQLVDDLEQLIKSM